MKRIIFFVAIGFMLCMAMSACAAKSKEKSNKAANLEENTKTLVVYFSWSGNTKAVGQHIAQMTKADVFEVERVKPYPKEYELCVEEAHEEMGTRPAIKGKIKNISDYDVVFIGVPVWSGTLPMPMFTFLEQHNLEGKTVIPFCTCYTSEGNSLEDIMKATPNSNHREGISIVTKELAGKGMENKFGKVDKWLKELGYIQ